MRLDPVVRYARITAAGQRSLREMDAWELLLFRQSGVLSRRPALQHLSVSAVARRLRSGRWRVAARGVYLTHTGPVSADQ